MNRYVEIFLDVEKNAGLFNECLYDLKIWPFLRLEMFRLIERQIKSTNMIPVCYRHKFNSVGNTLMDVDARRYCQQFYNRRVGKDVLFVNSKHRMVQKNGVKFCPVTSTMAKHFGDRGGYITHSYQQTSNIDGESYWDVNYDNVIKSPKFSYEETDIEAFINRMANQFSTVYNVIFDADFFHDLKNQIIYIFECRSFSYFYEEQLSKLLPKAIVFSSYYEIINMFIIDIANNLGINTIEMQHGIIGAEHIPYNTKVNGNYMCHPRYMFTYGQFDKETMRPFVKKDNIYITGNSYLNYSIDNYSEKSINNDGVLIVAFINNNDALLRFAVELKKRTKFPITYRMHPERIDDAEIRFLVRHGISVTSSRCSLIYDDIVKHDYIISTCSTVLHEALCFGKNVFSLELDIDDERSITKKLPRISNVDDFILKRHHFNKTDCIKLGEYFYARNQFDNACLVLEQIISAK